MLNPLTPESSGKCRAKLTNADSQVLVMEKEKEKSYQKDSPKFRMVHILMITASNYSNPSLTWV